MVWGRYRISAANSWHWQLNTSFPSCHHTFFFFFDIFSDTCTKIRPSAAETLYLLFVLAYCKMSYSSRAKFLRTSLISLDNNSYENMPLLKDFGRKIFHETCDYKVVNLMPHLKVGLFVCCHVQIMKSSTATVLH